jgi:hypothetical protein
MIDHVNDETKSILEKFTVSDAQNVNNYQEIQEKLNDTPNDFAYDRIAHPQSDDKVEYNKKPDDNEFSIQVVENSPANIPPIDTKPDTKKFITSAEFGVDAPYPVVACANSSINDRYKSGPKKLLPYSISCGSPNKLTAENYYKTFYHADPIPLEDYFVRGANYDEYSSTANPYQIGSKILSENTKGLPPSETKYNNIPIGYNFAFHNSPAMRMP